MLCGAERQILCGVTKGMNTLQKGGGNGKLDEFRNEFADCEVQVAIGMRWNAQKSREMRFGDFNWGKITSTRGVGEQVIMEARISG